jgi:hypothetical protein
MKSLFFVLCSILIAGCLGGCATTRLTNSLTRPDGSVSTIEYTTISTAWPGGKLDSSTSNLKTQFGAGTIAVGQTATGWDNTGQAALLEAVISASIKAAVKAAPIAAGIP